MMNGGAEPTNGFCCLCHLLWLQPLFLPPAFFSFVSPMSPMSLSLAPCGCPFGGLFLYVCKFHVVMFSSLFCLLLFWSSFSV
jgi:hypothetical protein